MRRRDVERKGTKMVQTQTDPREHYIITSVLLPALLKTHVPSLPALWLVENVTAASRGGGCVKEKKRKRKTRTFLWHS